MLLIRVILGAALAWAAGPGSNSTPQAEYFEQLLGDYADFVPRRMPVHHPRELGAAASLLYTQLHRTFRQQTFEERRQTFRFFGALGALGLRHGLDHARPDADENEYRRDLRRLMAPSADVPVPHVVRMLVLFARGPDFAPYPEIQGAAREALGPVVDELIRRGRRADLPGTGVIEVVNLLGYIGTSEARAATSQFNVVVLKPTCDPYFL